MTGDVDPNAVLSALGFPAVGPPVPISGGWDTLIWRFRTADGRSHALRLFREDQADGAHREQVAIRAAAAGGIPAPAIEATGTWQGRPVVVLSWAPGATLFSAIQRRPWRLRRLATAFAQTQARLHALPAPDELQSEVPVYVRDAAGLGEPAVAERLLALPAHRDCLLHLDYHPLNVLASGSRITAVLDWTSAAAGDRRADVARTAALIALAPIPASRWLRPVLEVARRLLYRSWARSYLRATGPLADLAPFMAWAGARFLHDTERRLGQPQVWATAEDLAVMRRWVQRWKTRAGLP